MGELGPESTIVGADVREAKLRVFMQNGERAGNTWNMIPVFAFPLANLTNDRESGFPYRAQRNLPLGYLSLQRQTSGS